MNDYTVEINAVMAAAQAVGREPEDINAEYLGCFAVRLTPGAEYEFLVQLTAALIGDASAVGDNVEEAKETAVRLAQAARTDQMGLDVILYFPGWKLFGEWEGFTEYSEDDGYHRY